mgnify:CR=1 FL=1
MPPVTRKTTRKKTPAATAPANEAPARSLWVDLSKAAEQAAQRPALRIAAKATNWDLGQMAEVLGIHKPDVIRHLKALLNDEYEAAKASGLIRRGRPAVTPDSPSSDDE